jgi:hypothetical protein
MVQTGSLELLATYAVDNHNNVQFYLHLALCCEAEILQQVSLLLRIALLILFN